MMGQDSTQKVNCDEAGSLQPNDTCDETFLKATKECDLIMKGGITSGVTYPPAILELAREYRFKSIGGTSAGAIAAVAAAAAEYGREKCGFQKLECMSNWLAQKPHLSDLFQPARGTRSLFYVMLDMITFSTKPKPEFTGVKLTSVVNTFRTIGYLIRSLLLRAWVWALLGALIALHLLVLLAGLASGKSVSWWDLFMLTPLGALLGDVSSNWQDFIPILKGINRGALEGVGIVPTLIVVLLGALIVCAVRLVVNLIAGMKNNLFGLCTGHSDAVGGPPALADWLSEAIDNIAGLPAKKDPLTFGNLKGKMNSKGEEAPIVLQLVTTNLSHKQAYMLPFQEGEKDLFIFNKKEMEGLFPKYVVDYMVAHAAHSDHFSLDGCTGYHLLPEADHFPLIVAIRLSLSVPPLVSAVPLYTVQRSAIMRGTKVRIAPGELQKNWFSDGGISSNFPIHLFDNLLSKRPTFAINLTSMPAGAIDKKKGKVASSSLSFTQPDQVAKPPRPGDKPDDEFADVYLPAADKEMAPEWRKVKSLGGFVQSIFDTAREHLDNTQSLLPSYRERIVHIRFEDNEGGMNLAMDTKTINAIKDKGKRAGEKLLDFEFEHHQWVRFKVVMAQLEQRLYKMNANYGRRSSETGGDPSRVAVYSEIVHAVKKLGRGQGQKFPFPVEDDTWYDEAIVRAEELLAVVAAWEARDKAKVNLFLDESPDPKPDLRVAPRV